MLENIKEYLPFPQLQPLLIMVRVLVCAYCIHAAANLNKSKLKWGLLGFFLPFISIVWIQFIKPCPLTVKRNEEQSDTLHLDPAISNAPVKKVG